MPEFSKEDLLNVSWKHAEERIALWLGYTSLGQAAEEMGFIRNPAGPELWDYYHNQRGGSCQ